MSHLVDKAFFSFRSELSPLPYMDEHVGDESPGLVSAIRLVDERAVGGHSGHGRHWCAFICQLHCVHNENYDL